MMASAWTSRQARARRCGASPGGMGAHGIVPSRPEVEIDGAAAGSRRLTSGADAGTGRARLDPCSGGSSKNT